MISWIKKRPKTERIVLILVFILFAFYAITLIFPFVWAVISALKTDDEYYEKVFALPKNWLFSNFIKAFDEFEVGSTNLIGMFLNSLWLTFAGTAAGVIVSSMTAYVIAKYEFRGRNFLFKVAIFTMIIPIVGNLSAMYKLVMEAGLNNKIGILALYAGGFGFNFIILHGYFRSVSWTYAEAGFIDGATDWAVFCKIILPQAIPAIVAVSILSCIGIWNDYMTPFLYLKNTPTLALGIYQFKEIQQYRSNVPIYYCAILLSTLPIILVFAFFQKTIMENTVAGGLKG